MPLNRDQPPELNVSNSVPSAPIEHQHTRSIAGSDLSQISRPSTPQNGMNNTSSRRELVKPNVLDGGRRYQLNDEGPGVPQPAAKSFRMPAPDTMQAHKVGKSQHSVSARFQAPTPKQENVRATSRIEKAKRPEKQKVSAFDDTESLNQSILDDSHDAQVTAFLNLKPQRVEQYSEQEVRYAHEHTQKGDRHNSLEDLASDLEPGWEAVVAEEQRRLQVGKQSPTLNTGNGEHVDLRSQNILVPRFESLQEPETPTRTQSAPPTKAQLHAPAPRKNVIFADADEIHSLSPIFRSSEMGREDTFEQPISRPNSAQPRVATISDQRALRTQQYPHSQPRQSHSVLPSQVDRFRHMGGHLENVRQESEKVSAPESDNQDFSEDERTQTQQQYGRQDKPLSSGITDLRSVPSRKRSHDDMSNGLDYSEVDLKRKSLSALQAEAFTRDPRTTLQPPPTDSVGNEMTLPQILENLSKVSEDAQRETFKCLTDEQWAKTGQWFVDKFQVDLKKLTEVRSQRRQIAMKYEGEIRRRQRLVEHHEAEVDRELQELQTGGKQLVDGRKVPSGSRSGTPLKGGR